MSINDFAMCMLTNIPNCYHGHVNFRYRYRWKAWQKYGTEGNYKSPLLELWHKLLWGTAGVD